MAEAGLDNKTLDNYEVWKYKNEAVAQKEKVWDVIEGNIPEVLDYKWYEPLEVRDERDLTMAMVENKF
ncbi:hypothetical protein EVAR_70050_1 [Eumeta japonica]|uniref:Uncharacterized protein n=1 Tax=Eumeta variegata TaxID=151549 RepID=A0A4C1SR59_EUMVA|nr:hypothetical protein EVAR_70050_1 [Eumeta japonica]